MNILVINAGSTSLKFGVLDAEARAPSSAGNLDRADGDHRRDRSGGSKGPALPGTCARLRPATALVCLAMPFITRGLPAQPATPSPASTQERRVALNLPMLRSSSELADFSGLVDEQDDRRATRPSGAPQRGWNVPSQHWKQVPVQRHALTSASRATSPRSGSMTPTARASLPIAAGEPGQWSTVGELRLRRSTCAGRACRWRSRRVTCASN